MTPESARVHWQDIAFLTFFALCISLILAASVHAAPVTCDPKADPFCGQATASVQPAQPAQPPQSPDQLGDLHHAYDENPHFASDIAQLRKAFVDKPTIALHGTEYILGQTATPFLQVTYANGTDENNASCFLEIFSPAAGKPVLFNSVPMIGVGQNGLYYFDFTPTLVGNHMMASICTLGSQTITTNTKTKTVISGTINNGGTNDLDAIDNNVIDLSALLSSINVQVNYTLTAPVANITSIQALSSISHDALTSRTFSACFFNYAIKKYDNCTSTTITQLFSFVNAAITPNSTGGNYLNTAGTGGILSVQFNSSVSLGAGSYYFDYADLVLLGADNVTTTLRGGGEVHVSANSSQDIIGAENLTLTSIKNAVQAANVSIHTALSNNFTQIQTNLSTLTSFASANLIFTQLVGANVTSVNQTVLSVLAALIAANQSLHGALSLNYTGINASFAYTNSLIQNQTFNQTQILNAINAANLSIHNALSLNYTGIAAILAALNISVHGALYANFTSLNAALSGNFTSLHIALGNNFTNVNSSFVNVNNSFAYTDSLILAINTTGSTTNLTPIINAIQAANVSLHGALSGNYTALQLSLSNVNQTLINHIDNANATILAAIAALNQSLDNHLVLVQTNLSSQISAVNVSIILVINDTNQSLSVVLSQIDNHVLAINTSTTQINSTTYQINQSITNIQTGVEHIEAQNDDILAFLLDLRKRFIDYVDGISQAIFRPIFGQ